MKIKVMENILEANQVFADNIRRDLKEKGIRLFNLIGGPGSGKTTLLENILLSLRKKGKRVAVIEGDCSTTYDAERIAKLDIPALQINTGTACHLDPHLIRKALDEIDYKNFDLIFVENVGNMVCPAEFDIGETAKVAVSSVAEGDEKPAKYPLLFHECAFVILTKMDLLPHTNFRKERFLEHLKKLNTNARHFEVTSTNQSSFDELVNYFSA